MEETDRFELLGNKVFQAKLKSIGFSPIRSGWFENETGDIRLRLWTDCQITFWRWRSSLHEEDNEIGFRGIILNIEDVKWVLERCFPTIDL